MPIGTEKSSLYGAAGAATSLELEILVVGGGGSGGGGDRPASGGGGAGGVLHASVYPAAKGQAYGTTVGIGGDGGHYIYNNGGNTVFDTAAVTGALTALGGGYGAIPSGLPNVGNDGGSGGGNVQGNTSTPGQGIQTAPSIDGVTVLAYGNDGGTGFYTADDGGGGAGGGANANSGTSSAYTGATGGAGKLFSNFTSWGTNSSNVVSGTKGYFAGGGGGGGASTGGPGGVGGGSIGGGGNAQGTAGLANTGGGGGGGDGRDSGNAGHGGDGGTGILLIRYAGATAASGGTITNAGGYTYHAFTSTGNSTFTTS